MKRVLVLVAILVAMGVAGCEGGTATPSPTPTPIPPSPSPTPIPLTPTTLAPTPHPTVTPTSPRGASDAAVNAARLRLTQGGYPELVSVISITPTVFPDDCLGLPSAMTCHLQETPGYIIELELEQKRYVFHVDQDGKQARLASSPVEPLPDAFIEWQYNDGQECKEALISRDQTQFGICGEAMLAAPLRVSIWDNISGQSQASYLKQKYAPFTAETIRGTLVFKGTVTVVASPAEERAMAEWALTRFGEANLRYLITPADAGLVLFWIEESASLCGGLWIYQTGLAVAWNCPGTEELGVGFLTATQMQQFYTWLDSGKRWNIERAGQVEGKPIKLILQFSGSDAREDATPEDIEKVLQFAREVYAGLTDGFQESSQSHMKGAS